MSKKELSFLKNDPVLKKLIIKHGELKLQKSSNLFLDLIDAIISQQLSVKASATILERFNNLFYKKLPTPEKVLELSSEKIRKAGISYSKIKYIKSLSEFIVTRKLILENLDKLEDEAVINELTKVKGIGRWTAEMILIFSLQRPDVFSLGDLGLRKAVSNLYNVDIKNTEKIQKISLKWSPYRSWASRYLWKSLS